MVAPLSIKDFAALVEKTKVMEKMKVEVEAQHPQQQRIGGPSRSKPRHEERRKLYDRPHSQSQKVLEFLFPIEQGTMLSVWGLSSKECLPSNGRLQKVQQLGKGSPVWQGLSHSCQGSDAYSGLDSGLKPVEEQRQQTSGSMHSLCHDGSKGSRLRL